MDYRILIIEDDPEDILLLKRLLEEKQRLSQLHTESSLGTGFIRLAADKPDVILLDLFLPDSQGLETFRRLQQVFSMVPTIVLTGLADEELGTEALKIGAQDFLTKGDFTAQLLDRSIRYAIERHQIRMLVQQQKDQAEAELQDLFRLITRKDNHISTEPYAEPLLEDSAPAVFHQLQLQFVESLKLALEEQKYKIDSHLSTNLNTIAQQLGALHGGPRDVVNLYRASLQELTAASQPEKARAYLDEGRILVLRLMGEVLSYYRQHSLKHLTPLEVPDPTPPIHR